MDYQYNKFELQAREYDLEVNRSGPLCFESEIYIRDYLKILSGEPNAHISFDCPLEDCPDHGYYPQLDFYQWRPIRHEIVRPFIDIPKWQNASFSEHMKWHSKEKPNFIFQSINQYIVP